MTIYYDLLNNIMYLLLERAAAAEEVEACRLAQLRRRQLRRRGLPLHLLRAQGDETNGPSPWEI